MKLEEAIFLQQENMKQALTERKINPTSANKYFNRIAVFSDDMKDIGAGEIQIKAAVWDILDRLIDDAEIQTLFTSMTYGADSAAAEYFSLAKKNKKNVHIVYTVPGKNSVNGFPTSLRRFYTGTFMPNKDFQKETGITGSTEDDIEKRDRYVIEQCYHLIFILDNEKDFDTSRAWRLFDFATTSCRGSIPHKLHIWFTDKNSSNFSKNNNEVSSENSVATGVHEAVQESLF